MSIETNLKKVQQFRCFEGLSDDEARAVLEHLDQVHLPPGQELFHQGDPGDSVYLLLAGQVQIKVAIPGQADKVLSVLDPGAIFGEMSTLLDEPRTATATALADVEAWKISHDAFQSALDQQSPWAIKFLLAVSKVLARRLASADQELVWIITDMHTHEEKPQVNKAHELEQLRTRLFTQWSF